MLFYVQILYFYKHTKSISHIVGTYKNIDKRIYEKTNTKENR